jgi:hypothetical protein
MLHVSQLVLLLDVCVMRDDQYSTCVLENW